MSKGAGLLIAAATVTAGTLVRAREEGWAGAASVVFIGTDQRRKRRSYFIYIFQRERWWLTLQLVLKRENHVWERESYLQGGEKRAIGAFYCR